MLTYTLEVLPLTTSVKTSVTPGTCGIPSVVTLPMLTVRMLRPQPVCALIDRVMLDSNDDPTYPFTTSNCAPVVCILVNAENTKTRTKLGPNTFAAGKVSVEYGEKSTTGPAGFANEMSMEPSA